MNHAFLSKETVKKLNLIGLEQQHGLVKSWRWNQENQGFFSHLTVYACLFFPHFWCATKGLGFGFGYF